MSFLMIYTPDGESFRYDLEASIIRLGRSRDNDLVLADQAVSRNEHARIEERPGGHFILNVGGARGTFVNEERITKPVRLQPGDSILIGRTKLSYDPPAAAPFEFSDEGISLGGETTIVSVEDVLPPAGPRPKAQPGGLTARALEVLGEANEALVLHLSLDAIFEKIMDLSRRVVPYERGLLMTLEDGRLVQRIARTPGGEPGGKISFSRTIADHVLERKEAVLTSDALLDDRLSEGKSIIDQGIRSMMCVPLWDNMQVIGLLYVDNRSEAGLFNEESLRVLTQLANIAAIKIEHRRLVDEVAEAELVRKELKRAADLQAHLLPTDAPEVPGYALHATSDACYSVGGDYYDYIELSGGRLGFSVADVAGKGLSAALVMSALHSSVQILTGLDLSAVDMANRLNDLLSRTLPSNRFITFFFVVLDPESKRLTYVNAGHTAPYVFRADGSTEELPVTGPPLGILPISKYKSGEIELAPGELLISYSDGVTEAMNREDEEFGTERLVRIVSEARGGSPKEVIARVREDVNHHLDGLARQDDTTILVMKRGE